MNNEQQLEKTAELLKVLAHPARIQIILLLQQEGELNVSEIQAHLQIEQSLLSNHLIKMKDKGILLRKRLGKQSLYSLVDTSLADFITLFVDWGEKETIPM